MKHITLEEAQLLYDLGATVWWRSPRCSEWSPTTQHNNYRPGKWEHDAKHEWE